MRGFIKSDNGWTGMVRSMRLFELACPPWEHDGFVLEPYVRDLASKLSPFLAPRATEAAHATEAADDRPVAQVSVSLA